MPDQNPSPVSFSRVDTWEQCPLKYKFRYVDKEPSTPGPELAFGSAVHAALEGAVREAAARDTTTRIDLDRVLELFTAAWERAGLSGLTMFAEGVEMLTRYVREHGIVDAGSVLGVEQKFLIQAGDAAVVGFIDRVNKLDEETIEIVDYKTNRQLFTRDEVDGSLQMSIYAIAARVLWPWAKRVRLRFHMLRHGIVMTTERTPEELDATARYVASIARQLRDAEVFPARLNAYCTHCDFRTRCPAYAEALRGRREWVCEDKGDLEAVAREREAVARVAKIAYARKEELERVLKEQLKKQDELSLAGVRYAMFNVARTEYPLGRTIEAIAEAADIGRDELVARIAVVDKDALEGLLKELGDRVSKARLNVLRAELDAVAEKSFSPRFWAKEQKPAREVRS